jgi:hypothetical protein
VLVAPPGAALFPLALSLSVFYYHLQHISAKLEQKGLNMFTSNVKQLMQEKKKTFQCVVDESGLSRQTIHKARSDSGISECRLSTLGRIANALDVPVKELFDGEYEERGVRCVSSWQGGNRVLRPL